MKTKGIGSKVVDVKEALIKEAEKTSLSDDFKKATEKMTSLMDQWKFLEMPERKQMMNYGNVSMQLVRSSMIVNMLTGKIEQFSLKMLKR